MSCSYGSWRGADSTSSPPTSSESPPPPPPITPSASPGCGAGRSDAGDHLRLYRDILHHSHPSVRPCALPDDVHLQPSAVRGRRAGALPATSPVLHGHAPGAARGTGDRDDDRPRRAGELPTWPATD